MGHEVGLHGYDHVKWHDRLNRLSRREIAEQVERAIRIYKGILGVRPESFAGPSWHSTAQSLDLLNQEGFTYSSDTRGVSAFFPETGGVRVPLLQIPTTLPTMDEMLGIDGLDVQGFYKMIISRLRRNLLNVLTVTAR
nr:DUF2334 domain-containing protein [Desulfobacterales bacterium]